MSTREEQKALLWTGINSFPTQPVPSLLGSVKDTFRLTATSCVVASIFGATLAGWRGTSVKIGALIMATNATFLSFPFIGIREGFLHYRYFVNDQRKLKHHLVKNKDQMIATTASGIVNGGLLAYHLRGSWMIIGGAIVYTSFAITGQFLYSMTRRWKQNRSLDKYLKRNEIVILDIPYSLHTRRDRNDFEVIRERFSKYNDPVRISFVYIREFVKEYILGTDFPKWASPWVNALDPEYHDELMLRLEILDAQIDVLEHEIVKYRPICAEIEDLK